MQELLKLGGGLVVIVAYGGFWMAVFRKAGYRSRSCILMTISMYVPLVNLGVAVYFAMAAWPIQTALVGMRSKAGMGTTVDAHEALLVAARLESQGDVDGAIAKYHEIIQAFSGSEAENDSGEHPESQGKTRPTLETTHYLPLQNRSIDW
jgi:hypothetical protein